MADNQRIEPGNPEYENIYMHWVGQGMPRSPFTLDQQSYIPVTDVIDGSTEWVFVKQGQPFGPEGYYASVSIGKR